MNIRHWRRKLDLDSECVSDHQGPGNLCKLQYLSFQDRSSSTGQIAGSRSCFKSRQEVVDTFLQSGPQPTPLIRRMATRKGGRVEEFNTHAVRIKIGIAIVNQRFEQCLSVPTASQLHPSAKARKIESIAREPLRLQTPRVRWVRGGYPQIRRVPLCHEPEAVDEKLGARSPRCVWAQAVPSKKPGILPNRAPRRAIRCHRSQSAQVFREGSKRPASSTKTRRTIQAWMGKTFRFANTENMSPDSLH